MKTYVCHRCGKKFEGRYDRCPRCGQLFVYERGGKYFDALGNQILLNNEGHIAKVIRSKKAPRLK